METQQMQPLPPGVPMPKRDDFSRVPGLYQRFEVQQVLKFGPDFYVEVGGKLTDGTELFVVYTRPSRGRRIL